MMAREKKAPEKVKGKVRDPETFIYGSEKEPIVKRRDNLKKLDVRKTGPKVKGIKKIFSLERGV